MFGSRVDDSKRGGDIDLLVVFKKLTKQDLRYLHLAFSKVFGEQKLDILLDDDTFTDPLHKMILQKAIKL